MQMEWWVWISLGIALLLAEALTPGGFYLIFIGIAAIAVGALEPLLNTLWFEIMLFAVLSTVFIAAFRKPLVKRLRSDTPLAEVPEFIGETARTSGAIAAGREGNVELRGTVWKAKNSGPSDLADHASCRIVAREGLVLVVKPEE